jgi:hypothetical protein
MHLVYELNSRLRYYSNPRSKRKYKKTTREEVTDARPLVDAKIRLVSLKSDDVIWIDELFLGTHRDEYCRPPIFAKSGQSAIAAAYEQGIGSMKLLRVWMSPCNRDLET